MAKARKEVEIIFESDDESLGDVSEIILSDGSSESESEEEDDDGQTWTITFSEQVENHAGMQTIGKIAEEGFSIEELETFEMWCKSEGYTTEMVDIELALDKENTIPEEVDKKGDVIEYDTEAKILIIRNGVKMLLGDKHKDFFKEVKSSRKIVDKRAWMRGREVNKLARYNLCYGEEAQKPDYKNKKGTIVPFRDVPFLSQLREKLGEVFCEKSKNLLAELNYYYDKKICGIGFHGDSERRLVIGVRIGASMNLQYQWFHQGIDVGKRVELLLNEGDIYVMSAKAVGTDWKRKVIPTLRHAAGCAKFTTIKKKKEKP